MRSEFENSIKWSSSYEKLVYQHGERLFIFDDDKYKIAAIQLAWELFKNQQSKVDELQKQLIDQGQRFNDQSQDVKDLEHKNAELQKRADASNEVLKSIRKEIEHGHLSEDESQTLSSYANDLEQALKGGSVKYLITWADRFNSTDGQFEASSKEEATAYLEKQTYADHVIETAFKEGKYTGKWDTVRVKELP